ncbi:hypothetical protein HI113_40540, partial [Corallococcus exiguus]|nr:hypothetical protein [Corallococcus exiguus]
MARAGPSGSGLWMLTGNEVGVLLGHYVLTQGTKRARPHVVTTIVS